MRIFEMEKVLVLVPLLFAPILALAEADAHADHEEGPVEEMMGISDAPVQRAINLFCRFEAECVEDAACESTDFELGITGRAGGLEEARMAASVTLSTVSRNDPALGAFDNGVLSLSGGDIDARFLLTVSEGGARFTQHYGEGPMTISYLGVCE